MKAKTELTTAWLSVEGMPTLYTEPHGNDWEILTVTGI